MSNGLDQDQDRRSVGPDMGPSCFQILHCISRRQNVIRFAIMQGTVKQQHILFQYDTISCKIFHDIVP